LFDTGDAGAYCLIRTWQIASGDIEMTTFVFDINKAVAAAAHLTKKRGGRIDGFILIKMLYAGERRAILEWHRPIIGDTLCAMPKGPILSRVYDLIKGQVMSGDSDMQKWSRHFSPRQGYAIKLLEDPDYDYLSEREIKVLNDAFDEIETLRKQHGIIADVLHAKWPEWKDPKTSCGKGSAPIELADILGQVLEDEDEIQRVCLEIQAVQSAKAALQTN
jgi:hypothetical protein